MPEKSIRFSSESSERKKSVIINFTQLKKFIVSNIMEKESKVYSKYNKEQFRKFMLNPKSNEKNLRNVSRFLYYISQPYKRLIKYNAEMLKFYYDLIPIIDFTEPPDKDVLNKAYYEMQKYINNLNLPHEMLKALNIAWRDGIFYGYEYSNDDSFFIQPLNPDYCRISSIEDGCLNIEFDFSVFEQKKDYLDNFGAEFTRKFSTYLADKKNKKWQELDPKKTLCIKIDESIEEILPPFIGIFEDVLDILDYKSLNKAKETIENYKLIISKIPMFTKSENINDFAIDLDDAQHFHNMLDSQVPEEIGTALSPMDIETIEFKRDGTESDTVAKSTRDLFDSAGTSQMLFNDTNSGSIGLDASIKVDEMLAFEVLRQIERWLNRKIKYLNAPVNFKARLLDITEFNRDSYTNRTLKAAQYGVPVKMDINIAQGINPLEALSKMYLENTVLNLSENMVPLQSSHTQSGDTSDNEGRPPKEELTDSGLKTRDSQGNQNRSKKIK